MAKTNCYQVTENKRLVEGSKSNTFINFIKKPVNLRQQLTTYHQPFPTGCSQPRTTINHLPQDRYNHLPPDRYQPLTTRQISTTYHQTGINHLQPDRYQPLTTRQISTTYHQTDINHIPLIH